MAIGSQVTQNLSQEPLKISKFGQRGIVEYPNRRLHTKNHVSSIIKELMGLKGSTLVLPFLRELSLQTRAKLKKIIKRILGCCIIQIVFKNQINRSNVFRFKDHLPYDLVSCLVYKFQCGRWISSYYDETDRHLKIRSGEHIDF